MRWTYVAEISNKIIFIFINIFIVMLLANYFSVNLDYAPSTITMYFVAGAVIVYYGSILYDRLFKGIPSHDEAELRALKNIIKRELSYSEEEIDQEIDMARKRYQKKYGK